MSEDGPDIAALIQRIEDLEEREQDRGRLSQGVERLADETGGLNTILNKVDEQQQRLTNLGKQLSDVQSKTVTKTDLAKENALRLEAERVQRRRNAQKWTARSLIALAAVTGVALLGIQRQAQRERDQNEYRKSIYNVCLARAAQAEKMQTLVKTAPASPDGSDAAARTLFLEAFPLVDCSGLKPNG